MIEFAILIQNNGVKKLTLHKRFSCYSFDLFICILKSEILQVTDNALGSVRELDVQTCIHLSNSTNPRVKAHDNVRRKFLQNSSKVTPTILDQILKKNHLQGRELSALNVGNDQVGTDYLNVRTHVDVPAVAPLGVLALDHLSDNITGHQRPVCQSNLSEHQKNLLLNRNNVKAFIQAKPFSPASLLQSPWGATQPECGRF
jgi:hypothetical protein